MSITLRSQIGAHLLPHKESKCNYAVAFHRCYWRKVGLQWMKRKGAILVLVWFLLFQSGYYLIRHTFIWKTTASNIAVLIIGFMIMIIFSPIAGWLADVHFGRYNVIKWSILIAWISSSLHTVSSVIAELVSGYEHPGRSIIEAILLIAMEIGLVGFVSNILQFTMDQFPDASTEEIVSFIRWMAWTTFSSAIALNYTLFCVQKKYQIIGSLTVTTYLTLAVCLDFLCNHHLIKEPVTGNPFRLVFNVIRYAIKTKQPRFRSAFTFHEDELPSRIDFGKHKYGGPFTTEQVEDAKTFLRFVLVIIISGALPGPTLFFEYAESKLTNQILIPKEMVEGCYTGKDLSFLHFGFGSILIPFYDFIIRPIFYKCIPVVSSQLKILVGFTFLLLRVLAFLSIDLYINQTMTITHNETCIFSNKTGMFIGTLDYRWLSVLAVEDCFSGVFAFIGIIEFLSSQVPYSMKGIFMDIFISIFSVFTILGVIVSYAFHPKFTNFEQRYTQLWLLVFLF